MIGIHDLYREHIRYISFHEVTRLVKRVYRLSVYTHMHTYTRIIFVALTLCSRNIESGCTNRALDRPRKRFKDRTLNSIIFEVYSQICEIRMKLSEIINKIEE